MKEIWNEKRIIKSEVFRELMHYGKKQVVLKNARYTEVSQVDPLW